MIYNIPKLPLNTSDTLTDLKFKLKEHKERDATEFKKTLSTKFKADIDDCFLETWELLNYGILPSKMVFGDNKILSNKAIQIFSRNIGVVYKNTRQGSQGSFETGSSIPHNLSHDGTYVTNFKFTSESISNAVLVAGMFDTTVLYICEYNLAMYVIGTGYDGSTVASSYANITKDTIKFFKNVADDYAKWKPIDLKTWETTYEIKNESQAVSIFNFNVRKFESSPNVNIEIEYKFKNMSLPEMRDVVVRLTKDKDTTVALSKYVIIMNTEKIDKHLSKTSRLKANLTSNAKSGEYKQRIRNFYMGDYVLTIAMESTEPYEKISKVVSTGDNRFARVIYRMSIIKDDWSYDFSHVESSSIISKAAITSMKNTLFKKDLDVKTFLDLQLGKSIELEVEFVGEVLSDEVLGIPLSLIKNDDGYQNSLYTVAKLINRPDAHRFKMEYGFKRLVRSVKDFTRNMYIQMISDSNRQAESSDSNRQAESNWFVSEKKDGIHSILHAENGILSIITNKLETVKVKTDMLILVEGEIVGDTIYLFNILNEHTPFAEKVAKFKDIASKLSNTLYKIKTKDFLKYSIASIKKIPKGEGLIFVDKNSMSYKWKYPKYLSIDFLAQEVPKRLQAFDIYKAKKGHFAYILLNGLSRDKYFQLALKGYKEYPNTGYSPYPFNEKPVFQSKRDDLAGKVIELRLVSNRQAETAPKSQAETVSNRQAETVSNRQAETVSKSQDWDLMRVRDDRQVEVDRGNYFGNDYVVAKKIWFKMIYPFEFDSLLHPEKMESYFYNESSIIYLNQRRFNSNVKWDLYKKVANDTIIDLAAGKGQDIRKVTDYFKMALFVDQDIVALEELQSRQLDNSASGNKGIKKQMAIAEHDDSTRLLSHVKKSFKSSLLSFILQADLNDDYRKNTDKIQKFMPRVDTIMLNFAIHYLIRTEAMLLNLIRLVDANIKDGGMFVFTCFNGAKVHDITETAYCNEKYCIKRNYNGKFSQSGQLIEVKLPFAKDSFMIEPLVNIDWVIATFKKHKFGLVEHGSFGDYLGNFGQKLDKLDKEYVTLYDYVILRKNNKFSSQKVKRGGSSTKETVSACRSETVSACRSETVSACRSETVSACRSETVSPCTKDELNVDDIDFEFNPHLKQLKLCRHEKTQCRKLKDLQRILGMEDPRKKYVEMPDHCKTLYHWGQRKLLLSEIEFFDEYCDEPGLVIYAGAAPGTHTNYLVDLFPKHHYYLVDPAPFHATVADNIEILNEYFTDDLAMKLRASLCKKYKKIYFICDIRSIVPGMTQAKQDERIKIDMAAQARWVRILKADKSMLKFRLTWEDGQTEYLKGIVHFQVWAPHTSTETRLIVQAGTSSDEYEDIKYDHRIYEEQMFYFNRVIRPSYYLFDSIPELGHCYDCAAEYMLMSNYIKKNNKKVSAKKLKDMIQTMVQDNTKYSGKRKSLKEEISIKVRKNWYNKGGTPL